MQTTIWAGTASNSGTYLYIDNGTLSNNWTGYIDDLRIYNVALNLTQIQDLFSKD
jgi:hypothetical protein